MTSVSFALLGPRSRSRSRGRRVLVSRAHGRTASSGAVARSPRASPRLLPALLVMGLAALGHWVPAAEAIDWTSPSRLAGPDVTPAAVAVDTAGSVVLLTSGAGPLRLSWPIGAVAPGTEAAPGFPGAPGEWTMNTNGDVLQVVADLDAVTWRLRTAGGGLEQGEAQFRGRSSVSQTAWSLADDGTAAVAWVADEALWLLTRPPGGPFGRAERIADAGAATELAVSAVVEGRVELAFTDAPFARGGERVIVLIYRAGTAGAERRTVARAGRGRFVDRVAYRAVPDGRAVLIYKTSSEARSWALWAQLRSSTGAWGVRQRMSRKGGWSVATAVLRDGHWLIGYVDDDGVTTRSAAAVGGPLSPPTRIAPPIRSRVVDRLELIPGPNRTALAVWREQCACGNRLVARAWDGARWGAAQAVSAFGASVGAFKAAVDSTGRAITTWSNVVTEPRAPYIRATALDGASGRLSDRDGRPIATRPRRPRVAVTLRSRPLRRLLATGALRVRIGCRQACAGNFEIEYSWGNMEPLAGSGRLLMRTRGRTVLRMRYDRVDRKELRKYRAYAVLLTGSVTNRAGGVREFQRRLDPRP